MAPSRVAQKLRVLQRRFDARITAEVRALLHVLKAAGVTDDELAAVVTQVQEASGSSWQQN